MFETVIVITLNCYIETAIGGRQKGRIPNSLVIYDKRL